MGAKFSNVEINISYAGVKIGVDSNSSFSYEIQAKYGGISLPSEAINTKQIDKNTSKYYEGSFNGGKAKLYIQSSYGGVKILTQ